MIDVFTSANYIGNLFTSEQNNNKFILITFNSENNKDNVIDTIGLNLQQFKTYEGTEELLESLLNKYGANSGIAGVQAKVMILDTSDNSNPKLSHIDRLTYKDITHIIKSSKSY
ncbi:MAG: hypothetical protein PHC75_00245 [Burkholderiales bacterium]|nr:hypothetical protein [Burkholderiales bacterium]